MNMYFNPKEGKCNLDLTLTELKDLQYMLMVSFDCLLDDKIFCSNFGESNGICSRRCESNLDWREEISDLLLQITSDEEEADV